jgi:hypothetical protein
MLLRHATLARNLASILRRGLLCSKSKGRKRVVWGCSPANTLWAAWHVTRRHGGRPQEIVVLEVSVPRAWARRHGGAAKGVYYSVHDIGPERIRGVITWGELSRSPVEPAA